MFIYLIERHPTFHPKVLALYQHRRDRSDELVTSTLTLGELLAQPLRHGRTDLAKEYLTPLTAGTAIKLMPFDRPAAEHYARIRAQTSLRQPDAMQLACAAASSAARFFTNDRRLWGLTVPGVETIRGLKTGSSAESVGGR